MFYKFWEGMNVCLLSCLCILSVWCCLIRVTAAFLCVSDLWQTGSHSRVYPASQPVSGDQAAASSDPPQFRQSLKIRKTALRLVSPLLQTETSKSILYTNMVTEEGAADKDNKYLYWVKIIINLKTNKKTQTMSHYSYNINNRSWPIFYPTT